MDRASEKVSAGALLGTVVLVVGAVLPLSAPRASTPTDGAGLFTPGLGCGPTGTEVGIGDLLAKVRADTGGAGTRRSDAGKARTPDRRGVQGAARSPAHPRSARKAAPQVEQEARAAFLRSFYTCNASPPRDLTEGTGWRLVGPLRQG